MKNADRAELYQIIQHHYNNWFIFARNFYQLERVTHLYIGTCTKRRYDVDSKVVTSIRFMVLNSLHTR